MSVFSGVAILVLLIPFNIYTGRLTRQYQSQQMKKKDKRLGAMYEILNFIKAIKYYAWELYFQVMSQAEISVLYNSTHYIFVGQSTWS